MIVPFSAEMFVDKTITSTTSVGVIPYEYGLLKNFEKIVQEKYEDRVFSLTSNEFMLNGDVYFTGLKASPALIYLIPKFVETLICTKKKIFLLQYAITPQGYRILKHTVV